MQAAPQPARQFVRFMSLGLLIAALEEFITQGVLKGTLTGWILPTLVAFVPFLCLMRVIGWALGKALSEAGALLIYWLAAGAIGLLVEWLLIGLSPWRDTAAPILPVVLFQCGMFSFWAGVAVAPLWLIDQRASVAKLRRRGRQYLTWGMAAVYLVAFAAPASARFPAAIGAVLILFLSLNYFHCAYVQKLRAP